MTDSGSIPSTPGAPWSSTRSVPRAKDRQFNKMTQVHNGASPCGQSGIWLQMPCIDGKERRKRNWCLKGKPMICCCPLIPWEPEPLEQGRNGCCHLPNQPWRWVPSDSPGEVPGLWRPTSHRMHPQGFSVPVCSATLPLLAPPSPSLAQRCPGTINATVFSVLGAP